MRETARQSCPCAYTTPCHERCTCINPLSSSGCRRCCMYGSVEQRTAMAERLACSHPPLSAEERAGLEWARDFCEREIFESRRDTPGVVKARAAMAALTRLIAASETQGESK